MKTTDFDGGVMLTAYNAVGKPEKITDKEGNETKKKKPAGKKKRGGSGGTRPGCVPRLPHRPREPQEKQTAPQQEEPAERVTEYTAMTLLETC